MTCPAPQCSDLLWPDLAGRVVAGQHCLPIRVYFEDTDFTGVAYHGSYVRWCERGRSDFLRCLGVSHTQLAEDQVPASFAVRTMSFDFLRPAKIDDVLTVFTHTLSVGGASLTLEQRVLRPRSSAPAQPPEVLVCAKVKVALISTAGRTLRIASSLRTLFQAD